MPGGPEGSRLALAALPAPGRTPDSTPTGSLVGPEPENLGNVAFTSRGREHATGRDKARRVGKALLHPDGGARRPVGDQCGACAGPGPFRVLSSIRPTAASLPALRVS